MTAATLTGDPTQVTNGKGRPRRWFGVAFGVLLGLAAVCHGCHLGDHDDELSVNGGARQAERGRDQPAQGPAGQGR